jgi:predicted metalloprotease with PDZ domain
LKKSLKLFAIQIFFIFLIPHSLALANEEEIDIHYKIYHNVTNAKQPKLTITCLFNSKILDFEKDKKSKKQFFYLELPRKWSVAENLDNYITRLHSVDSDTQIVDLEDKTLKIIIANPSKKWITLSYDVYPKGELELLEPIINQQIFHFVGYTLLIYPQIDLDKKIKVGLTFDTSVKNNTVSANSFGFNKEQELTISLKAIQNATYAGGAYQVDVLKADKTTILIHGAKNETREYIKTLLNKIIPVQKEFWKEEKNKNNIVFVHANDYAYTTMSGTRTPGALSILVNESSPFLKEDLPEFLAHEYWHTWMGGNFSSAHSYKHMAWLFEGVTDYYAHKTAYQSGVIDLSSWKDKYNRILARHYLSSVKNKSNQHIIRFFDENPIYEKLPYDRGEIIALELDRIIQNSSQGKYSFDDVIKDLFLDKNKQKYETRDFQKSLQKFYPDAKNFVKLYITEGKNLPLSTFFFDETKKLEWVKIKPEEYGIDLKSMTIDKIVSGISKKSVAYQQGLRNGQKIISHEVNYKDINKPILLKTLVLDNTEQEFLLERKGKAMLVPQYY